MRPFPISASQQRFVGEQNKRVMHDGFSSVEVTQSKQQEITMHLVGQTFISCALMGVAALGLMDQNAAHAYPTKPVTIMVPYPAGGPSDLTARLVGESLSKAIDQTVIVENLGGAGGTIAAQRVLNAPADGYTLFQGSPNELILAPMTIDAASFQSDDFSLLQKIADVPMAVLARSDLPASNGDELARYVRDAAARSEPATYASVGPGSFYHLLGAHMANVLDAPMTHIPYRGAAPAINDLVGGRVDIFITPFGLPQMEMAQQGRLKFVATLTPERHPALSGVPTLAESDALQDFVFSTWAGYFVDKDVPDEIQATLNQALIQALGDPKVRVALEAQNRQMSAPLTLEEASDFYAGEIGVFRDLAKSTNFQAE